MRIPRVLLLSLAPLLMAASASAQPFLQLEDPEPYELIVQGFTLDADATIHIDAVGRIGDSEGGSWVQDWRGSREDRAMTCYAWILDSQTRKPVWVMDAWETERVKGNRNLRESSEDLELPAGRYELCFYSGHGWLMRQVEDNQNEDDDKDKYRWGRSWSREVDDLREDLAQCYVKLSGPSGVSTYKPDGVLPGAVLSFNQTGNSQLRSSGLLVKNPARIRIYSLIEFPKGSQEPADYGWIVDEASGEVVWSAGDAMTRRGGGSRKNRLVDEEIDFDPGRYIVYFGTDDSHSYEEFNANPPYDPLNWGITLVPVSGASGVSTFAVGTQGDALIDFSRTGDGAFLQQHFRLTRESNLRIYAVGEYSYSSDEFVDYAWIVNEADGRVAWEMTERNTMGAGGAEKNRMFNGSVTLPKGDYTLYYVTDDSHSYEEWNAATPFDPQAWGVQVFPGEGFSASAYSEIDESELAREKGILVRMVRMGNDERRRERFHLDRDQRVHIYALGEGDDGDMYDYAYIVDGDSGNTVWEMTYRKTVHAGGAKKNRLFDDTIALKAGNYEVWYVSDGSHSFEGFNSRRPKDPMAWGITIQKVDQ